MMLHAIEDAIARRASETAFVQGQERVTYAQIDRRAHAVSAGLVGNGLKRGDRVGLKLEPTLDYAAGLIGIWRAGATAVPLDSKIAQADLARCLELARVGAIITEGQASAAPDGTLRLCIGELTDRWATAARAHVAPADDAVLLFTSGTTGAPKGVIHTQASLGAQVRRNVSTSGLGGSDVVLATAMFNSSFGLNSSILEPLLCGALTVIVHPFHPRVALDAAAREGVTWLQTVPAVLKLLTAVEPPNRLPELRSMRIGAATLDLRSRSECKRRFGLWPIQGYGMSEIGRIASDAGLSPARRGQSVGIPEVDLRLFDDQGGSVGTGELGEIGVRDRGLCRPYYLVGDGRHEPLPMRDGYFMTGDLGRLATDGSLELAGRRKMFILTPRYKVDPREVEEVLLMHPSVDEAVALPAPGEGGYELVKGIVAAARPVTPADLVAFCRARLPVEKCPRVVEVVDRLPRNALGKVEIGSLTESADDVGSQRSRIQ